MTTLTKQQLKQALQEKTEKFGLSFLDKSDKDTAIDVLAKAFHDDPAFTWVADLDPKDPHRDSKIYTLNRWFFGLASDGCTNGHRGYALGIKENDQLLGCLMVHPGCTAGDRLVDFIGSLFNHGFPPMVKFPWSDKSNKDDYGPSSMRRLGAFEPLLKRRAENMNDTQNWIYLHVIGVLPSEHGKGHGKRMLNFIIEIADSLRASLYLETESKQLESMYQHFEFQTLETLDMHAPGDEADDAHQTMYLMRRDPV